MRAAWCAPCRASACACPQTRTEALGRVSGGSCRGELRACVSRLYPPLCLRPCLFARPCLSARPCTHVHVWVVDVSAVLRLVARVCTWLPCLSLSRPFRVHTLVRATYAQTLCAHIHGMCVHMARGCGRQSASAGALTSNGVDGAGGAARSEPSSSSSSSSSSISVSCLPVHKRVRAAECGGLVCVCGARV